MNVVQRITIIITSLISMACAFGADQPNIVWIMAEDISLELECYGHPAVKTPHLNQLAADGSRYTHAFGSNPSCSPNRSAMMLGVYQTRTDSQDHRRRTDRPLPEGMKPFTQWLKDAGYYTALGCGYNSKNDLNFPAEDVFEGKDWKHRAEGQPFFAQITLYVTHRDPAKRWKDVRAKSEHPVDPDEVVLPPYYPDTPECRMDWAMYLDAIEHMDKQVGEILARLDREGIADNTVVIFIGDNGRCHLRGKNWLYDGGLRVPLIIRWPEHIQPGTVNEDMTSLIDVTATILDIGGIDLPDYLDGHPILGDKAQTRDHIFAARDQMGNIIDHSRAVRTRQFKYIRNYMPEVGYAESKYTSENRPILPVMQKLNKQGRLTEVQQMILAEVKPAEELYDVLADPHEIKNLADSPMHQETLKEMSALVDGWVKQTKDTGLERMRSQEASSQSEADNDGVVKIKSVKASGVYEQYVAENAVDGTIDDASRWIGSLDSEGAARLELTFEQKRVVTGVHIYSGYQNGDPIQDFHFEYKDANGQWQTVTDSVTTGNKLIALDIPFDTIEVDTDTLRLVVKKSKGNLARVKEVIVWQGEVPKIKNNQGGDTTPVVDRATHQMAVNQVGYVTSRTKRFTAPLSADGTEYIIRAAEGTEALHRGVIKSGIGDFTEFRPDDALIHYVIEIDDGALKPNVSDPFLISENLLGDQFWQTAVDFLIDVRSAVGTHPSAFGGCPWRDGTYYDTVIPSLVLFYLADQDRVDAMPRQIDWHADKARVSDPSFKLVKAPNSGGVLEATRKYYELEPPKADAPDVVKLIHWGAGYYLMHPETCDPSGDPEKWKIHAQTVEQVAYVVWAWPVLEKWLPQSFYDQCLEFCLNNWEPSMQISKWWHPDSYTDIYSNSNKNPWAGKLHPYKGRHAPGHSIVPNLLMYEVAKRDGLDNPEQYLSAAVKQTEWIIENLDWNEPRTTKGHRVSEHRTIPNLVWLLQHYPEHAPEGLKEKITAWAKVAVSRSENMWDFRRFDLDKEWTIPKLNDVGNSLSLPAIATAASWVVDDPALKRRLQALAVASVDHVFGRNPRFAAAPDREDMGFPEVERGWPVSHKHDVCARLELCRGSISSLPGTEMYPFNPEGNYRHREGWVNYGANWCISLSYFMFDKNGQTTPTP